MHLLWDIDTGAIQWTNIPISIVSFYEIFYRLTSKSLKRSKGFKLNTIHNFRTCPTHHPQKPKHCAWMEPLEQSNWREKAKPIRRLVNGSLCSRHAGGKNISNVGRLFDSKFKVLDKITTILLTVGHIHFSVNTDTDQFKKKAYKNCLLFFVRAYLRSAIMIRIRCLKALR